MFKIIGGDRKEYGPVSADQIRDWIRENRVNAQTMACPEGTQQWTPLGKLPDFALEFSVQPGPAPAGAVPLAVPPLVAPGMPGLSNLGSAGIDVFSCLGRSWRLVWANLGLLAGATLLVMLIVFGTTLFGPLGAVVGMVIQGPLVGGLLALYLRRIRGQSAAVGDTFAGFGPSFVQLMVVEVAKGLLVMLSGVVALGGLFLMALPLQSMLTTVFGGMLLCVGLLPPVYLSVAWQFALPLVIDKQMDYSEALELSLKRAHEHWFSLFGLLLLGGLFAISGMFFLGVGMLFTMPVFLGSVMYAYEDLFGAPPGAA